MGKEQKKNGAGPKTVKPRAEGGTTMFHGGTGLQFNSFIPKFLAYLEKLTCKELIEGDGPETTFDLPRPCPDGEEEAFLDAMFQSKTNAVKMSIRLNKRAIQSSDLSDEEKSRRIVDLKIQRNNKFADLVNGQDKAQLDLATQISNWEKQKELFLKKKGACINAFYECFGTAPLSICSQPLNNGEVRAAWNTLVKSYNSGVGGQQSIANILSLMNKFNAGMYGTLGEAFEAMYRLENEYKKGGPNHVLPDALLLEMFLCGLERSGNHAYDDLISDIRKKSPSFAEASQILYERESTNLVKKMTGGNSGEDENAKNDKASDELFTMFCHAVSSGKFNKKVLKSMKNGKHQATVCNVCKKPGHREKDCWTQKTCNVCNEKGHIGKFCPKKKKDEFNVCASLESEADENDHAAAESPEIYCNLCDDSVTHKGCSIEYDACGCHEPVACVIEGNVLESMFTHAAMSSDFEGVMVSLERKCHYSLRILLDSGASGHMFPCWCLFIKDSVRTVQGKVSLGKSDYKLPIVGRGITPIDVLDTVLLVPDLSFGLISLSSFDKKGFRTVFGDGKVVVMNEFGRPVLSGTLEGSLYYLDDVFVDLLRNGGECQCESANVCESSCDIVEEEMMIEEIFSNGVIAAAHRSEESRLLKGSAQRKPVAATFGQDPIELLHKRLGHLGAANIKKALRHKMYIGAQFTYEDIKDAQLKLCPVCMEGRMKAFSSPNECRLREFDLFEKIAMDYKGKFSTTSVHGYTGFYLISDYGSNNVFAYPVKSKDEESTIEVLEKFISIVRQSGKTVKVFQCDSDSVLLGGALSAWFVSNGIAVQASAPRVHWQNGFIESNMGKVMDKTRTLMADGRVPHRYWVYALLCACYLINISPFGDSDVTPHQIRYGEPPDISHLVPFWSPGVYHKTKEERKGPWDYKAVRCRMLGYPGGVKNSYFVLDIKTRTILTRHDCVFDESIFESVGNDNLSGKPEAGDFDEIEKTEDVASESDGTTTRSKAHDEEFPYWKPEDANNVLLERWVDDVRELVCATAASTSGVKEFKKLPVVTSIGAALSGPDGAKWREALDNEWKAFEDRKVFKPAPQQGRAMKTKLIFKAMYDNDYSIKYKARLVACGYSQVKGLDYDETYAPTISTVVIFIAIQIGAMHGMKFSSFDVTAAFLEGKNDFQNFARLPKELGGLRVEVIGNFYGEKQGPKIWNDLLHLILILFGFERCPAHPCLYRFFDAGGFIIVVVHVDDGLMIFNDDAYRDRFMKHFSEKVQKVTMKETVQKYVGMDFLFDAEKREVTLSHKLYIAQNYSEFSPKFDTPMATNTNLRIAVPNPVNESMLPDTGKLRFICDRARPDLLVVTGELATGGDKSPSDEHVKTRDRVRHYLSNTIDLGMKLGGLGRLYIFGYSDAAYITDGNCKSRLGGCIFMNSDSGAVRSFSKNDTQPSSTSHSSTEAEIKAIDEWIREAMHIMDICGFLLGKYEEPLKLFVDNLSAIELCESLKQSHKVKHINLRIHFVREMIESGFVQLNFVPTDENVADVLTKFPGKEKFIRFTDVLMHGHGGIIPSFDSVHCAVNAAYLVEQLEEC